MLYLRASLGRYTNWATVLPELGVAPRGRNLPAAVRCAVCREDAMRVLADRVCGGQWYWCPACGFAGDAIELAAAVEGCDPVAAALRIMPLIEADLPAGRGGRAAAEAHERDYVEPRRRHLAFWRLCRGRLAQDSGDFDAVQRRFGLGAGGGPAADARRGLLLGTATVTQARAALRPASLSDGRAGTVAEAKWGFRGGGWGPLVVVPFWDLPGRISGFLMVGRRGGPGDFEWVGTVPRTSGAACGDRPDPGVGLLPAALAAGAGPVVACPDAEAACRMQGVHLADHEAPLPLVIARAAAAPPRHLAAPLPGRRLVVWGAGPEALALAAAADAAVAAAPPWDGVAPPATAVRAAAAAAGTWQSALERHLAALPESEAAAALARCGVEGPAASRFLAGCAAATRARLAGLVGGAEGRVVRAGPHAVRATADAWYASRARADGGDDSLVTDAPFAIDRVVFLRRTGRSVYQGRVRFRGREYPLRAAGPEFERNPFAAARAALQRAGAGVPTFDPAYARLALLIAQQLHPPAHADGLDRVGWDEARAALVLPGYVQEIGGRVADADLVIVGEGAPGDLPRPDDELAPTERAALSAPTAATAVAWAVAAHVAAHALGPAAAAPPRGLLLVGDGAAAAGMAAARSCGCRVAVQRTYGTGHNEAHPLAAKAAALLEGHGWAAAAAVGSEALPLPTPLATLSRMPPGIVTAARAWDAALARLAGGWAAVDLDGPAVAGAAAPAHLGRALAHYLRDYCARRMPPLRPWSAAAVLADMRGWAARAGVADAPLAAAAGMLAVDDAAGFAAAFATATHSAVEAGLGAVARDDVRDDDPAAVVLRSDGLAFVPAALLEAACARRRGLAPDPEVAAARLAEAGVLAAPGGHAGRDGWLVDGAWWRSGRAAVAAGRRGLKVEAGPARGAASGR